jgi:hypothetical protein
LSGVFFSKFTFVHELVHISLFGERKSAIPFESGAILTPLSSGIFRIISPVFVVAISQVQDVNEYPRISTVSAHPLKTSEMWTFWRVQITPPEREKPQITDDFTSLTACSTF